MRVGPASDEVVRQGGGGHAVEVGRSGADGVVGGGPAGGKERGPVVVARAEEEVGRRARGGAARRGGGSAGGGRRRRRRVRDEVAPEDPGGDVEGCPDALPVEERPIELVCEASRQIVPHRPAGADDVWYAGFHEGLTALLAVTRADKS